MICKNCKSNEVELFAGGSIAVCADCGTFRISEDNTWTHTEERPVEEKKPEARTDYAGFENQAPVPDSVQPQNPGFESDLQTFHEDPGGDRDNMNVVLNVLIAAGVCGFGIGLYLWRKENRKSVTVGPVQ